MRSPWVFSLTLLVATSASAQAPASEDHARLQKWRFRTEPVAVPAGGLAWSFGGASWMFESGRFWLQEPTSGGAVTGLVFEGSGRFRLAVPDAIELAQLRRFAERPGLAGLDEPFSSLVLRTSGELPLKGGQIPPIPPANAFAPNPLARERHEIWLLRQLHDADARVLAALGDPGDLYLRADMKTAGLGWLAFDYDGRRLEEIRVESYHAGTTMIETWLALDRPEERDARGRPASEARPAVDIEHVDIAADLTQAGRDGGWVRGRFRAGVRAVPNATAQGARTVQLFLTPRAKVTAVSENGRPLTFLRDHVGGRTSSLDNQLYDNSLVVLLEEPLTPGTARRFDVEYEMDMLNYARGRSWYPEAEGDETQLTDVHTARLELTVRKKHEVRAMGVLQGEPADNEGNRTTSVWTSAEPVKMLTFSFAERFHEEKVQAEGLPEVICFGPRVGMSTKNKFWNVGADVANSISYFEQLLDARLPRRPLYVTGIQGGHGQSFDSFIHMGEGSFDVTSVGATELFRAHEVAHQWWGHLVGEATYRDVWLAEAFAEYSAMMFVQATMKDGPKLFQEILVAYRDQVTGSFKSDFSRFSRSGLTWLNRSAQIDRIGPIGHGWRANTGEVPIAYLSQVYTKGALVLHMLRSLLNDMTRNDQVFIGVLRDFVRTHRGGHASTRDFEAALANRVPAEWSWFFDQWVYANAIPTYRWRSDIAAAPNDKGQYTVALTVRQSDVPPGFKMPVPVTVEFPGGKTGRLRVLVDEPEETFTLSFPEKPKGLTFNPDSEVLSRTKRD
jgi:hypothetical protein